MHSSVFMARGLGPEVVATRTDFIPFGMPVAGGITEMRAV